jgi:3-oxoacyl-[acyl-carrier protein] reductase
VDLNLRARPVLVTGGSRGVGRQVALAFAHEGARVAICARDAQRLQRTADEIRELGVDVLPIPADLTEPGVCERVVDETVAAFGGIYALVNNAGIETDGLPTQFEKLTDEQLNRRIVAKAMTTIRCCRAAVPHMRAASGGRIVCIGGISAKYATRGRERPTGSGSSLLAGMGNAMIANFSKMLGEEVNRDNVLINVIHPAIVNTDRMPSRIARRAAAFGMSEADAAADIASQFPLGRFTEPADLAPLIVLLASPLNGAITGQAIAVDGGLARSVSY